MCKLRVASVLVLATLLFLAVIQAEETTEQVEATTDAAEEASDPPDTNNEEIAEPTATGKLESKEETETEAAPNNAEPPPTASELTTTAANVDKVGVLRKPSTPLKDSVNAFHGKKRCRCIEKKHRHVLKQITYVPLEPILLGEGQHKRFNCNCQQMRKMEMRRARPTYIVPGGPPPRQSWG